MEAVRTLRVGKTMIDVFVGRNLHILDRDQEGSTSIVRTMNAEYLNEITGWLGDVSYDRVFTYQTDGYIAEWIVGKGFKYVPTVDTELYMWFLEVCKERRERQNKFLH